MPFIEKKKRKTPKAREILPYQFRVNTLIEATVAGGRIQTWILHAEGNVLNPSYHKSCFRMEKNETMERNTYIIGPDPQRKFKAAVAKECIRQIIGEAMTGRQYNPQEIPSLSRSLADSIKDKLKEAGFDRYKLVVQVIIGQQRGETIKVASRFLWDADTDNFAQDVFVNDSLFCVATAFGCYYC